MPTNIQETNETGNALKDVWRALLLTDLCQALVFSSYPFPQQGTLQGMRFLGLGSPAHPGAGPPLWACCVVAVGAVGGCTFPLLFSYFDELFPSDPSYTPTNLLRFLRRLVVYIKERPVRGQLTLFFRHALPSWRPSPESRMVLTCSLPGKSSFQWNSTKIVFLGVSLPTITDSDCLYYPYGRNTW